MSVLHKRDIHLKTAGGRTDTYLLRGVSAGCCTFCPGFCAFQSDDTPDPFLLSHSHGLLWGAEHACFLCKGTSEAGTQEAAGEVHLDSQLPSSLQVGLGLSTCQYPEDLDVVNSHRQAPSLRTQCWHFARVKSHTWSTCQDRSASICCCKQLLPEHGTSIDRVLSELVSSSELEFQWNSNLPSLCRVGERFQAEPEHSLPPDFYRHFAALSTLNSIDAAVS